MYGVLTKRIAQQSMLSQSRILAVPTMRFATGNPLNDKEKGDERIFFTKNDGKLRNHLLR